VDEPRIYEIRVEGQLAERWSGWFGGLAIRTEANGETTLSGFVADQAALFGLLNRIQALNLTLIAVTRLPEQRPD
jgi:hypothetical protein